MLKTEKPHRNSPILKTLPKLKYIQDYEYTLTDNPVLYSPHSKFRICFEL